MNPKYKRMVESMKQKQNFRGESKGEIPWFLYILRCKDGSLYTGVTKDLQRRIKMHNTGRASRYTRPRRPVVLLYHEKHPDRARALIRECEVKSWPKEKKEKLTQCKRKRRAS